MLALAEKRQPAGTRFGSSPTHRPAASPRRVDRVEPGRSLASPSRAGFDFSRISIHPGNTGAVQKRSSVNRPGDPFEREADAAASRVMNTAALPAEKASEAIQPSPVNAERPASDKLPGRRGSQGVPLSSHIRAFMEPRFKYDFSRVRVHTDRDAIALSRGLNAQAFTHNEHIFYGAGRSPGVDALTAHELAHVVQQAGGRPLQPPAVGAAAGRDAPPSVQRVLEVKPPGPHDASAFDRRDLLIDRLNAQSPAIHYFLDGREIHATVVDAASLTEFDRRMKRFIDQPATLPMRLTSGADRVSDGHGHFVPLMGDSFGSGNVDLDDLLADDDFSFRSDLVHFLTERASVPHYAQRVGSNLTKSELDRGHQLGKDAEAAVLQDFFHDPTIRFNYDGLQPNHKWLNNFVSHDHHYQVFQVVAHPDHDIAGGEMFVRTADGRRVSMDDFKAQRDAARGTP